FVKIEFDRFAVDHWPIADVVPTDVDGVSFDKRAIVGLLLVRAGDKISSLAILEVPDRLERFTLELVVAHARVAPVGQPGVSVEQRYVYVVGIQSVGRVTHLLKCNQVGYAAL